jgi:prolyl 4-hydroxylase
VGQEFKAHTDYFEPNTDEYVKFAGDRGNRTWTFMIYLNETKKGGGTNFVKLDKIFYPKKGAAVVWNNLCKDGIPNPNSMHAGMPVEKGEKVVITKWFREKGTGPMFREQEKEELCSSKNTPKNHKPSSKLRKPKR